MTERAEFYKNLSARQKRAFHFICGKMGWTALMMDDKAYSITQEQLISALTEFAEQETKPWEDWGVDLQQAYWRGDPEVGKVLKERPNELV